MPPYHHSNMFKEHEELSASGFSKEIRTDTSQHSFSDWFHDRFQFKTRIIWINVVGITILHIFGVIGLSTYFFYGKYATTLFGFVTGGIAGFGVTAGAHRFWTHRSYKANIPLRIILMLCYAMAGQNSLYDWVRDHRVHHRCSETDADPHNSNRGFFFSHVGWLMMKKHPDVMEKGKQIDMSDVLDDPIVKFHMKYFTLLKMLLCFIIPTIVPIYCWNESWFWAFVSQPIIRYVLSLNFTWLVNSLAHISGTKPYDKRIKPVQNKAVAFLAMGEGWHNYHHSFPWDYKTAELGDYSLNWTTMWIDLFAKIGWAYDLRQPSKRMVMRMVQDHGDGSHGRNPNC